MKYNSKYKSNKQIKSKKKIEFSKKWLVTCVVISLFYTTLSYVYGWFDKNTLETLSVEIIEILWGTSGISFVGYALQNCVRAYTASKFGIPKEDIEEEKERNGDSNDNNK